MLGEHVTQLLDELKLPEELLGRHAELNPFCECNCLFDLSLHLVEWKARNEQMSHPISQIVRGESYIAHRAADLECMRHHRLAEGNVLDPRHGERREARIERAL